MIQLIRHDIGHQRTRRPALWNALRGLCEATIRQDHSPLQELHDHPLEGYSPAEPSYVSPGQGEKDKETPRTITKTHLTETQATTLYRNPSQV